MSPLRFPPELHSIIIRLATHTPVYFDISPDPRFWPAENDRSARIAPDYKTKKALVLVSRHFRYLSLPYLYEVVEVRRSSSMHRLANVLETNSSDSTTSGSRNPRKIEYLFVSLPDSNKKKTRFFTHLGRVLPHCWGLEGFGLNGVVSYWLDGHCNWLKSIPKSVRFVDWQGHIMACDFSRMVESISESLVSLRFSKIRQYYGVPPSASLPKLTHLSMPEENGEIDVLHNWNMPSLTHVYINTLTSVAVVRVIERAGNSLRSVTLGPKVAPGLLSHIATAAPNLEECTYHFRAVMDGSWATIRSHPSLRSIVVVFRRRITPPRSGVQSPMYTFCSHLQPLTGAHFPKVRRVGFVGLDPYSTFDARIRTRLDDLLDGWKASGIEVKYLGP